ncbi:DUF58 domain-containing protein [Persephonella atlantica]|uniref:DUF58 domain-containing protein n=1 Tax=Persephonella atlantica TaxID=2699429 RepID=A0ABS1GFC0_9AQUI|nr:DUF58 domain-containing protein [Persephonella atlantica]MBK3331612.1 DUF58 domain-containing protein [Persephonella atlantica]
MEKSKIIRLKIKQKVLSFFEGQHKTLKFGEEDDLKNIREYTYGDNVKRINWIITAKEKKPYIVEREEVKGQNIIVIILIDQNFLFGRKMEKLLEVYSIIGYSALYQKDRLFTYIFSEGLEKYFPHRNSISVVDDVMEFINSMEIRRKRLKIENLQRYIFRHRRSLVIIIGDLFYLPDIKEIAYRHKTAIIKIRERVEENPEKYTGFQLTSFDKKERIPYLVKPMVKNYIKNLKKIDQKLRQFAVLKRIPVQTIYTDEDPFVKLKKMFS